MLIREIHDAANDQEYDDGADDQAREGSFGVRLFLGVLDLSHKRNQETRTEFMTSFFCSLFMTSRPALI